MSNAAFWDARYAEPGFAYGDAPNDFVRAVAHHIPDGPVLCLAEGEGRNAVFLAQLGHRVRAVDLSQVGLDKARRLATAHGVEIETEQADLATYEIAPGEWAGVVAIWAHVAVPVRQRMLGAAIAGLRSGGVLVFEAYSPRQLAFGTGGPPDAALLVEPEDLRRELAGTRIELLEELEREVHEGAYHRGPSAVVRALAVKL